MLCVADPSPEVEILNAPVSAFVKTPTKRIRIGRRRDAKIFGSSPKVANLSSRVRRVSQSDFSPSRVTEGSPHQREHVKVK